MANNAGDAFDRINKPRQEPYDHAQRSAEANRQAAELNRRNVEAQQAEATRQERLRKAAATVALRAEIGKPLPVSPALALVRRVGAESVAEFGRRGIQLNFSIPNVYRSLHVVAPETVWKKNWRGKYSHVKTGELKRNLSPNAGRFLNEGKELRGWSITTHNISDSGSSGTTSGAGWESGIGLGGGSWNSGTTTGYSPSSQTFVGAAITTNGRVIGWSKRYMGSGSGPSIEFSEMPIVADNNFSKLINFAKDLNPEKITGWENRIHELGAAIVFNAEHPEAKLKFPYR